MSVKARRFVVSLVMYLAVFTVGYAQTQGDSIVASLLTCSPGTEAYSLYGHTGLRIRNYTRQQDLVFNYGVFNFNTPHFVWRFVLGQCDYEVWPYPFEVFMEEYEKRGSSVMEQTLNLTQEEANRLFQLLIINSMPENRTYRYNFLTNNCTTRARDQIEAAVNGKVVYEGAPEELTYRGMLHQYTEDFPWSEQGNDILLGADCDTLLSGRAAMFLPAQLMRSMVYAQVYDAQNNRHPLVSRMETLLEARPRTLEPQFPLSPMMVGLLALALSVLVFVLERMVHRMMWGYDFLLMTLQGVAGILLCFMFLFSEHPTMDSNWQIWVFNPLPLLCMPWVLKRAIQKRVCAYHYANALCLTLFVVMMLWIPQDFSTLTLPLALCLLTRPVSYLWYYRTTDN